MPPGDLLKKIQPMIAEQNFGSGINNEAIGLRIDAANNQLRRVNTAMEDKVGKQRFEDKLPVHDYQKQNSSVTTPQKISSKNVQRIQESMRLHQ